MATKREVMLAGTPAKLAHMLASDSPNVLAPLGTDQASAALVETNFQVLYSSLATEGGNGVRLRPASGQWLHFLFNGNFYAVEVYPDGNENINDLLPGEPFLLEAFMTGVFAPARRQWIAGQLAGSGAAAQGATSLPGPLGVGVNPPADAVPGDLFVENVMAVALSTRPTGLRNPQGRLTFNAYWDAAGTWRYLANGSAFMLNFDSATGTLTMTNAPSGLADQPIPTWEAAGAPLAQFGTGAGPNGTSVSGAFALGRQSPADALAGQMFLSALICMDLSARQGFPGNHGRMTFNAYWDMGGVWRYLDAGPALLMRFNTTTMQLEMQFAPAGVPDQQVFFGPDAMALTNPVPANMPAGQTALTLSMNEAGTIVTQPVLVSAAGAVAGLPPGSRVLYVAT
jgi:hypothetical protein